MSAPFIKSASEHQYDIKSLTLSRTAPIIQHFQYTATNIEVISPILL